MYGHLRIVTIIAISLMLYACGGSDSNTPLMPQEETESTPAPIPGPEGDPVFLGSGSSASFTEGVLELAVTSLSAGGQTTVTATLADFYGNLFTEEVSVAFTSDCVSTGLATITSPITTTNGVAVTNYEAEGCSGNDTITAMATVKGVTRKAEGMLTVQPAVVGTMQFVSATPSLIGIKGFGLNEVSEVVFRVLDTDANPVAGQTVSFSLTTNVGGLTIPNTTDTTDANGLVQANVLSGTVATPVRVTATLESNPSLRTQSDGLNVSTGIAEQGAISLSLSNKNPEAWSYDGVEVDVTVLASDHFHNPVPDGTAIAFRAEGGQIQSQCLTSDGGCSVKWKSSEPRPPSSRVTVLATILGEEPFNDANGNGVMDYKDTFTDVPEAFEDDDENGLFNEYADGRVSEEFLDFNNNGIHDSGNGEYNGFLCCDMNAVNNAAPGELCYGKTFTPFTCSPSKNIHVWADGVIVMGATYSANPDRNIPGLHITSTTSSLAVSGEVEQELDIAVFHDLDASGTFTAGDQVPPSGTIIEISATNGTLESDSSFTVPSTNANDAYWVNVKWKGDATPSSGWLSVTATVPSGIVTGPLYIDADDNVTPP